MIDAEKGNNRNIYACTKCGVLYSHIADSYLTPSISTVRCPYCWEKMDLWCVVHRLHEHLGEKVQYGLMKKCGGCEHKFFCLTHK